MTRLLLYAFRQLLAERRNTVVQVSGLVIGIVSCMLLMQFVIFEYSYDRFHENARMKYRVDGTVPLTLGPLANEGISYVENYARLHPVYRDAILRTDDESFLEKNLYWADGSLFSIFSFPVIEGDAEKILSVKNNLAISQSFALKYFGDEDPLGKTIEVNNSYENNQIYTVGAVFKDIPENSHLKFDILLSMENALSISMYAEENPWRWGNFFTYFELNLRNSEERLQSDLNRLAVENGAQEFRAEPINYRVISIIDLHLNGLQNYMDDNLTSGSIFLWAMIAIIILVIAWLNNINISIASGIKTRRKQGIKKVFGASVTDAWAEHLYATILVNFTALCLAVVSVTVITPVFYNLTGLNIRLPDNYFLVFWTVIILLLISGVLLSAMISISFRSGKTVMQLISRQTGSLNTGYKSPVVMLMILQFSSSVVLICFALLAQKQLNEMADIETGINIENFLAINSARVSDNEINLERNLFEKEVLKIPGVKGSTSATYIPGIYIPSLMGTRIFSSDTGEDISTRMNFIGYDYLDLFGHKFVAGRNFSDSYPTDPSSVVINRKLSDMYGFTSPKEAVGKAVYWPIRNQEKVIVGVVDNYLQRSADKEIEPVMFHLSENAAGYCIISLNNSDLNTSVESIQALWDQIHPDNPFDYLWIDKNYDAQLANWRQFSSMAAVFSAVAVLVACIGLFGLTSIILTSRIREIGIRKVNGAKIWEVMTMLNFDFVKWVVVAFILATPVAWYAMNRWLQNFAYRTELSWWIFALAGVIALGIALLTVSWQSWMAARRNPVEALRDE